VVRPIMLVVWDDVARRGALASDLERRFSADYDVRGVGSTGAESLLNGLAQQDELALILAHERLDSPSAVEVFELARRRCPAAKRVLIIERGNWSSIHPAVATMALGQIDFHMFEPWRPLERSLYPAMAEFLAAWDKGKSTDDPAIRMIADTESAAAHQLRDVCTRIGLPYLLYDPDNAVGRALLEEVGADPTRLPVVVFFNGLVLQQPTHADFIQALGLKTRPDSTTCDVAVVGGGPAGLAAAVYAASEGLTTMVLEPVVPGGQAGTSSLIRNYLGFNRGVSGADLTNRAVEQAWLFGVDFVVGQEVTGLTTRGNRHVLQITDGTEIAARACVLACGVSWRRLGIPELEELVGTGVYYGAAGAEAMAMAGRAGFVVGAGNSAGQAALHLARYASTVTMVVRGDSLGRTMSDYLVRGILSAPNITVRLGTEVVSGEGADGSLRSLVLRDRSTGTEEAVSADGLFLLIGAEPRTTWLGSAVERDAAGYVLTGPDLVRHGSLPIDWPLERHPMLLETSRPGVFAAGDVRYGSVKRVAAAVGAGAIAVQLVHSYLAEQTDEAQSTQRQNG
jgi:thioredoxin reductase (NADPH)